MRHAYPFRRQIRKGAADSRVCDGHPPVARHDAALLQRFLLARRRRDEAAARAAWSELVELNFDRVVTLVRLESRGRLSAEERDDAVQRALVTMLTRFMDTFRGTSMGEWVARRGRSCTSRASTRSAARRPSRAGRRSSATTAEQEVAEEHDAAARARRARSWTGRSRSWRTAGARSIELDLEDLTTDEIAERLGVSRDVVYAARSRALKDLAKLREEFEA